MRRVAVVTDSSADIAPQIAAGVGITVVPATIALGTRAFRAFAAPWVDATTEASGRAAVSPEATAAFASAFSELARTHDEMVAVLLSSRLGRAVEAATQAREDLPSDVTIEIVDSRSASLGLGFQALRAAEMAEQGADGATIAAALRAATDRYHVVFCVESVEYLRQSGQIGRSAALIAEALRLKPLLRIDEGQIVPYERVRTRLRAMAELADFVSELPAVERCSVLHAASRADAQRLAEEIAADTGLPPARLTVSEIGSVVASQVGPGALGVAVVEADIR
jgi:DegV family protein with EDD domain